MQHCDLFYHDMNMDNGCSEGCLVPLVGAIHFRSDLLLKQHLP